MKINKWALPVRLTLVVLVFFAPTYGLQTPDQQATIKGWAESNRLWLLDNITPNARVPAPNPTRRRLILSYDLSPEDHPYRYHRSATYDNALAAVALVITGDYDEAAFILHALGRLLRRDGSLWFGYSTANTWPDERYHESALVRIGAASWAGYAFVFYLEHAPHCSPDSSGCLRERSFFRHVAERIAEYIVSQQVRDPRDPRNGLLRLGHGEIELAYDAERDAVVEHYQDEPALGISTENNISAWFFLRHLSQLTGGGRWREVAEEIYQGLRAEVWNDQIGQFNRGFHPDGRPDPVKALDCASWGALLLFAGGEKESGIVSLRSVEKYFQASHHDVTGFRPYFDHPIYKNPAVGLFYYPEEPRKEWRTLRLVWSEGSLGVALAYIRNGNRTRAIEIIAGLEPLQYPTGGMRYASVDIPFEMSDAPSVAGSAWLVIVSEMLAGNPVAQEFWR